MSRKVRYGRTYGALCVLCGAACEDWQTCVLYQATDPKRFRKPTDYECLADTSYYGPPHGIYTVEMVAAREAKLAALFPFMTPDEVSMASILDAAAQVSAKAGGSAGSGAYSKYVRDCKVRARKRSPNANPKGGENYERNENGFYDETDSDDGGGSF